MLRVIKMRMRMMRMLRVNPLQQRNGCSGCRPLRLVQTNIKCNLKFCFLEISNFVVQQSNVVFLNFYVNLKSFVQLCTSKFVPTCTKYHFCSSKYFFAARNKLKCTWDIQLMSYHHHQNHQQEEVQSKAKRNISFYLVFHHNFHCR